MKTLEFTVQGAVAIIRINRPEVRNAINQQMISELGQCQQRVADNPDIRAVLMTGNGKSFCAGADLMDVMEAPSPPEGIKNLLEFGKKSFITTLNMPVPVVSAVNGVAAGGGVGVALAADVVIAGRSASFVQTFGPKLGLVPDLCSSWFYTQALGVKRALPLMLLGEKLSAEQAAEWGLVWKTVDDDVLFDTALDVAQQLAAGPNEAFMRIRHQALQAQHNSIEQQYDLETKNNIELAGQSDCTEGVMAFLEKRDPKFARR